MTTTTDPVPDGAELLDLVGLAAAWTAGDLDAIRRFHTADAIVATPSEVVTSQPGERAPLGVAAFAERITGLEGQTMRIVFRVRDKSLRGIVHERLLNAEGDSPSPSRCRPGRVRHDCRVTGLRRRSG